MTVYYGKELYHHGVKGQKWGTRRYQNEDGSYTSAAAAENGGLGRYASTDGDHSEYKKGLRRATLTGGLVGRALYKRKHSDEANAVKQEKIDKKEKAKADKAALREKKFLDDNKKIRDAEDELNEKYKNTSYADIGKTAAKKALIGAATMTVGVAMAKHYKMGGRIAGALITYYGAGKVGSALGAGVGSTINKAMYAKSGYNRHKYSVSDAEARERYASKQQGRTTNQAPKKQVSDYDKGLRRATLEGGLIGRAMYKRKNSQPASERSERPAKSRQPVSEYDKGLRRATLEGGLVGRAMYKRKNGR